MLHPAYRNLSNKLKEKKLNNIFDLDVDLFESLNVALTNKAYLKFHNEFYSNLLVDMFIKETTATIVTTYLFKNNLIPDFITKNEQNIIINYLHETAKEEKLHAEEFRKILINLIDEINVDYNYEKITEEIVLEEIKKKSIDQIFLEYYIGECSLLSLYSIIYQHTRSQYWKESIRKIMIDEANHTKKILEILKIFNRYNTNLDGDNLETIFWEGIKYHITLYTNLYFNDILRKNTRTADRLKSQLNFGLKSFLVKEYQKSFGQKLFTYYKFYDHKISYDSFVTKLDTIKQIY